LRGAELANPLLCNEDGQQFRVCVGRSGSRKREATPRWNGDDLPSREESGVIPNTTSVLLEATRRRYFDHLLNFAFIY
jgi:hypothetical protein